MKDIENAEVLSHLWKNQVTQIYGGGVVTTTKVAAVNPLDGKLIEKNVWFKTD